MKFEFIKNNKSQFPIEKMAEILGVSRSGYYKSLEKKDSPGKKKKEKLKNEIKTIFEKSRKIYGSIKIYEELKEKGLRCSKNTVAKYMQLMNLFSKRKKKFKVVTTDSNHDFPISKNLLNRNFIADKPNKVWVSDITYIPTNEGWLYLCVVLDLYSRMVVGWSMTDNLKAQMVVDSLNMAYMRRKPGKGLIFHSDRGSQYASNSFRKKLKIYKMKSSMSRKGDCWDNACAESMFATLKTELTHDKNYKNREEAKKEIFEYIEIFYNRERRHSTIEYLSPYNFEQKKVA